MATRYSLDYPVLYWEIEGNMEIEAGLQFGHESLQAARDTGKTGWHILCDLTLSTENRSQQELRSIAGLIAEYREFFSGRMANVVASDLLYGASRVLRVMVDRFEVELQIFETREDALKWLTESEE